MMKKKKISEPNLTAFDWAKPELGLGSGSGFLWFQVDAKTQIQHQGSSWLFYMDMWYKISPNQLVWTRRIETKWVFSSVFTSVLSLVLELTRIFLQCNSVYRCLG